MKRFANFIKSKILGGGQKPLPVPRDSGPVNMTRILSSPRNILVVPYNRMGTILLTTRVFKALREHFGEAKITVAVHESWSVLIKRDPTIDELVMFGDFIENPHSEPFKSLGKMLAEQKYDLAFFLSYQYDEALAYLVRLSNATLRVSFNGKEALDYFNIGISPAPGVRYEVERYLEMFRTMGIYGDIREYMMSINDTIREKARLRYLPSGPEGKKNKLVGFDLTREIVGSPITRKNAEHVIKTLVTGVGATVAVFYEPDKTTLAAELKEVFGKDIILVEDRPVSMLAGMMSYCRFVVAHNTDLFQLAVALRVPLIGILTERDSLQWSPGENENLYHLTHSENTWPTSNEIIKSIKTLLKSKKSK